MADADDLAAVPLFDSLDRSELEALATWFDVQNTGEGIRLTGEGAAGYSFFVLVEGSAVVTAEDAQVARLGPGDFFGEMAILGNGRRVATVTTTAPAKLLVLFGTEFRRLQQAYPEVAARIAETVRQREDMLRSRSGS
jgi:CRP-like cAMP-binding protein